MTILGSDGRTIKTLADRSQLCHLGKSSLNVQLWRRRCRRRWWMAARPARLGRQGLCESISIRGDDHHVAMRASHASLCCLGLNGLNGLSLLCRRPGNGPWIDRWPKSDSLYRRPWFVTPSFGSLVATDPLSDDGKPGLATMKAEKTTTRSVQPEQNTVRNLINSHISYLKHRFKDA